MVTLHGDVLTAGGSNGVANSSTVFLVTENSYNYLFHRYGAVTVTDNQMRPVTVIRTVTGVMSCHNSEHAASKIVCLCARAARLAWCELNSVRTCARNAGCKLKSAQSFKIINEIKL